MRDCKLKRFLLDQYELIYELHRRIVVRLFYKLPIMSTPKTIQYILDHQCSISRFGDGELYLMLQPSRNLGFQDGNPALAERLSNVFRQQSPNLLICLPQYMNSVYGCTPACKKHWRNFGRYDRVHQRAVSFIRSAVNSKYRFGNSLLTRPYIDRSNKKKAGNTFSQIKQLWEGRDLLIVEGEKSRLGVGNDLFTNAKSIKRILAPATNAFDQYDDIVYAVCTHHSNELVLLALGPTATILAADLSQMGIQTLDIGHIDIEYEWFLQGAASKTTIIGKYTNEHPGENIPECTDEEYLSQIICSVL